MSKFSNVKFYKNALKIQKMKKLYIYKKKIGSKNLNVLPCSCSLNQSITLIEHNCLLKSFFINKIKLNKILRGDMCKVFKY
ncbi:hypothetical protein BpHYR1_036197 [Brachionus plicatilis]|uniref:Uncharacterized protein n=1 Tax=Brachionus plicatilis TaxID=10195 RepID=A0A3M7RKF4_BRAPC|nr:hypothetical protein BpHYR1_036197 [Brachionus plicatilis]